jgi:hypothetical protein
VIYKHEGEPNDALVQEHTPDFVDVDSLRGSPSTL